jgi:hypothetical protein
MGIIPLINSGKLDDLIIKDNDKKIEPILVGTYNNKFNKKSKKSNSNKHNLSMKSIK